MKSWLIKIRRNHTVTTALWFWGFWFLIFGGFFVIVKPSLKEGAMVAFAILGPNFIPVHILSWLFDYFFNRKKLYLFFLIAIPLGLLMGLAGNQLFDMFKTDPNTHTSNELLVFIFSGMFIGFKYVRVALSQRILLKEAENKRVLSELQLLRAQLNPHFLFNALNSIYSLIIAGSDKAGEATLSLSELMRFHIASSGKQTIPLKNELEMLTKFIALEKLRLNNKCSINIETAVDAGTVEIAPLILIPFVENAFKYSISNEPSKNIINIRVHATQDKLDFLISNTISQNRNKLNENNSKMGIANTRKRLELHYKNNHSLNIENNNEWFTVHLQINLRQL
ncbi:MAG: histidine kinase [Ferruginibacter sp.]